MRQKVLAALFLSISPLAVRADDPATERKPAVIDYTELFDHFDTKIVSRRNYRESGRGDLQIDAVVLQTIVSSDLTLPQVVYKSDRARKSSHYIVNWRGEIFQMVRDKDVAFHSGRYDARSIGIVCQLSSNSATAWTPPLREALKALVRYLCQQYDVPRLEPDTRNSPGIFCLAPTTGRPADVRSNFYGSGWADFIKAINVPPRLLQEHMWHNNVGATEYAPYAMVIGAGSTLQFVWDPIVMEELGEWTSHGIRNWQFQLFHKNPALLNTANPWESVIAPTLLSGTGTTYTAAVGTRRGLFEWKLSARNDYGWGEVATMRFYHLDGLPSAPSIHIDPLADGSYLVWWDSQADEGVYIHDIVVAVWNGYGYSYPTTTADGMRLVHGETSQTIPNWQLSGAEGFYVTVDAWNDLSILDGTPTRSQVYFPLED